MANDRSKDDERFVAFDSNVLTYFVDGNRGEYKLRPDDPIADQRIAAVRLFLWCRPVIVPTVTAEASRIVDPKRLDEHIQFIRLSFAEFSPDANQQRAIEVRAAELRDFHPTRDLDDCRILAEVEVDGDVPVLVTWDSDFRKLALKTNIRLESPMQCWETFDFAPGTPPRWTPAPGHPLHHETWWRW